MNESYAEILERLEAAREALLEELEKILKDLQRRAKRLGLLCKTSHQHSAISSLVANR